MSKNCISCQIKKRHIPDQYCKECRLCRDLMRELGLWRITPDNSIPPGFISAKLGIKLDEAQFITLATAFRIDCKQLYVFVPFSMRPSPEVMVK